MSKNRQRERRRRRRDASRSPAERARVSDRATARRGRTAQPPGGVEGPAFFVLEGVEIYSDELIDRVLEVDELEAD